MKQSKKTEARKTPPAEPVATNLRIETPTHVLRQIRQHARSSMSAEICGVLIGSVNGNKTVVEAAIPGQDARQGGTHVTFTQETWTHIYRIKDAEYPEKRIVGWYHSHPGFGIFLSDHDTFIHRNFFSDPNQVAWVYDPHSDEEGCFAWKGQEIVRVAEISLRDELKEYKDIGSPQRREHQESDDPEPDRIAPEPLGEGPAPSSAARWVGMTLLAMLALMIGFVLGWFLSPRYLVIPPPQAQLLVQPAPSAPEESRICT